MTTVINHPQFKQRFFLKHVYMPWHALGSEAIVLQTIRPSKLRTLQRPFVTILNSWDSSLKRTSEGEGGFEGEFRISPMLRVTEDRGGGEFFPLLAGGTPPPPEGVVQKP